MARRLRVPPLKVMAAPFRRLATLLVVFAHSKLIFGLVALGLFVLIAFGGYRRRGYGRRVP